LSTGSSHRKHLPLIISFDLRKSDGEALTLYSHLKQKPSMWYVIDLHFEHFSKIIAISGG
jgi:hypothetical protein